MGVHETIPGSEANRVRLLRTKLFIPQPHPDLVPRPGCCAGWTKVGTAP